MINPCKACSAMCCKTYTITVTSFDIQRAATQSKKSPEEFTTLHPVRLLAYDPDTVLDFENAPSSILGIKSHPCYFIKENLCTIYNSAPLSCKRYPHTINNTVNPRFCPFTSQILFKIRSPDLDKTTFTRELNLYKEIVKKWNKKQGKKENCLEYLLKATKNLLE
ncbi:MAG: YkgJ family cysteine cluster protein [Candidatus Micrarchaeota archaeon]